MLLRILTLVWKKYRSWGCSVSRVSDYGLEDPAIGVRSPAGAKDFSSNLCVQASSEVYPGSCTMGTGGPFPGAKRSPGRDADHSPPSGTEVKNEQELYLFSPQAPQWRVPRITAGIVLQEVSLLISILDFLKCGV
jgi:hypothetical protein